MEGSGSRASQCDFTAADFTAAVAPSAGPRHFSFVDALRGWAILGVLLIHATMFVPHFSGRLKGLATQGMYGVQLFFVISAFTLFWSLRSRTRVDRAPLLAFFTRRVCRIGPLFWTALLFYGTLSLRNPNSGYRIQWAPLGLHLGQFASAAIFLHGWYPSTINAIVPGGWSIAAEFSFYLTIPFLFFRIRTLNAALWLTLIATALAGILQGPAVSHLSHHFSQFPETLIKDFVGYTFPMQFPVFCLGLVLYFLLLPNLSGDTQQSQTPNNTSLALLLVMGGLLCGVGTPPRHIFMSMAFVAVAYGLSLRPFWLIVNPVTRFIGTISYSGYIWHFWIMGIVTNWVSKHVHITHHPSNLNDCAQFLAVYVGTAVGVFPVAVATYYLIEVPGQNAGKWIIRKFGWGAEPRIVNAQAGGTPALAM